MIDNLPKGWIEENISDVVFFQEGPGVRKTQFTEKGVKLLNVGNINDNKINLSKTKIYISEEEAYEKYNHFLVENGDLLIACSGIVVNNFHKKIAFITEKDLPLCLNTSTMRFRTLDNKKLNINFYKYFLMTNIFKNQLQKLITGSAQLNFGPSHIKKMFIPIPQLQQQEKIVKVLDLTSNLIEKQKELLEKYDLFLKSKFIEMFGDPITNPMDWEVVSFSKLANIKTKSIKAEDITNEIYIGLDCIEKDTGKLLFSYDSENEEVKSNKYLFSSNMLLYGKLRPYLNKVLLPKFDGICSTDILPIEPIKNKSTKEYLAYFLRNTHIVEILSNSVSGANLPRVSPQIIKELKIMEVPIELQNKFASIVEKIERIKEKENQKLKQLEDLHNSLMQKAFKGEIV